MKENINVKDCMDNFIEKILKNYRYLNGLDTAIGDGDHGDNMKEGVLKLRLYIDMHVKSTDNDVLNPQELFNIMSVLFLSNINGASGPLYAVAFKNMAQAWNREESLSSIISQGAEGIKRIGHCEVGDKTMLDVWDGVYNILENGEFRVDKIQELVEDTANKVAKKGRASYFGDRSIGHIDPGAQSSAYFFEAMLEAVEK